MKRISTFFIAAAGAAVALLPGCSKDISEMGGKTESGIETVTVTVSLDSDCYAEPETRSSFTWLDDAIRDVEIVVAEEDGSVQEVLYSQTSSSLSFEGKAGHTYFLWAAANIGRRIDVSTLSDFTGGTRTVSYSQIASSGVPMYSAKADGSPGPASITVEKDAANITIPMVRMLAKVDFRIDRSKLASPEEFKVKSVRIYNAINSYAPFTANVKQARSGSMDHSFDYATQADVNSLNAGSDICLYAFENMQGDLLAGNTDPWAKVPSRISGSADYCTYLELGCSYSSGGLSSDGITYRMYLGSNTTTNFDVKRNTRYSITLCPTEAEIDGHRGSWKITNSGWNATLTGLGIDPSSSVVAIGKSQAYTVTAQYSDGTSEDVTAQCSWSSDNTGVATVKDGTALAVSAGTAHITAAFEGMEVSATLTAEADAPVVTYEYKLELFGKDVRVAKGSTAYISRSARLTTVIYWDGKYHDTTYRALDATLESDNEAIATVSKTTVTGNSVGHTTVHGYYNGIKSVNTLSVTVFDDDPTITVTQCEYKLEVTPGTMSLDEGGTGRAAATLYTRSRTGTKHQSEPDDDAEWGEWSGWTGQDVTEQAAWSSSNSGVAGVSKGVIEAEGPGTATITATYGGPDGNEYSDSLELSVNSCNYEIVVREGSATTGNGISQVHLIVKKDPSRDLVATLYRNGEPVGDATYQWNESGASYYSYSDTNDGIRRTHVVRAVSGGKGRTLSVTGYVNGKPVATSRDIEVIVDVPDPSFDYYLDWTWWNTQGDPSSCHGPLIINERSGNYYYIIPDEYFTVGFSTLNIQFGGAFSCKETGWDDVETGDPGVTVSGTTTNGRVTLGISGQPHFHFTWEVKYNGTRISLFNVFFIPEEALGRWFTDVVPDGAVRVDYKKY